MSGAVDQVYWIQTCLTSLVIQHLVSGASQKRPHGLLTSAYSHRPKMLSGRTDTVAVSQIPLRHIKFNLDIKAKLEKGEIGTNLHKILVS